MPKAPAQSALFVIIALSVVASVATCDQELDLVAAAKDTVPVVVQFGLEVTATVAVTNEHGQPATDVEVRLVWGDADRAIRTDRNGRAEIPILKPMWTTGAKVRIPEPYRGELIFPQVNVRVIARADVANGAAGTEVSLAGLERLEYRGVLVYYPKGKEKQAWGALDWLLKMRKYMIGSLGVEPVTPYGLAFFDTNEKALTIKDSGREVILPFSVEQMESKDSSLEVSWAGIHEWVELSLVMGKRLYMLDDRLRFAGDGLAEYAAFVFCRNNAKGALRQRFESYIARCDEMLARGEPTYDLMGFKAYVTASRVAPGEGIDSDALAERLRGEFSIPQEDAYGYPMSFWLWWDLVQRKGPDVPRKLIGELGGAKSFEDVMASLEGIAGEKVDLSPNVAEAKAAFQAYLRQHN
jgi:hypothetical protein